MKRLIAVLTGLVMLCGIAAACAEEALPYLETQNQDVYINSTILTEASYPQVCISHYSAYAIIESNYKEPWFVTFPGPAGASCSEFNVDSCQYFDLENYRQYFYQATDSYSYETFLNKCQDENNIVLDGSDTVSQVTISAPRSVIDAISSDNIVATADFRNITPENTVPIHGRSPGYG